MPPPRLLPAIVVESAPAIPTNLAEDMLYGVREIADELGLTRRFGEKVAEQRVYQLRRRGKCPIFKMDGVGLVARRSALKAYIERQERSALDRSGDKG